MVSGVAWMVVAVGLVCFFPAVIVFVAFRVVSVFATWFLFCCGFLSAAAGLAVWCSEALWLVVVVRISKFSLLFPLPLRRSSPCVAVALLQQCFLHLWCWLLLTAQVHLAAAVSAVLAAIVAAVVPCSVWLFAAVVSGFAIMFLILWQPVAVPGPHCCFVAGLTSNSFWYCCFGSLFELLL
ncbi:hypothetical protein U1Q18_023725 [Sarracenia purpurea var. burkii]